MEPTKTTMRTEARLTLFASILILLYHAVTAFFCHYLPELEVPLYALLAITGYAWYGCILSLYGIYGTVKRSPTFICIFANHLMTDTVISIVPKLCFLYLFSDFTSDVCSLPWQTTDLTSFAIEHSHDYTDRFGAQTRETPYATLMATQRNCEFSLHVAQGLLLASVMLWTVAQWKLGTMIKGFAVDLEESNKHASHAADMESGLRSSIEKDAMEHEESSFEPYTDDVTIRPERMQ